MSEWRVRAVKTAPVTYEITNNNSESLIATNIMNQGTAQLIAAAPELFEACKYALKTLSKVDIEIETTKIHKAINKAEGDNN